MKKTLLVAALATGFAGVAHAESSVTLYGLVDLGVGYEQTKVSVLGSVINKTRTIGAVVNQKNGSRWGLKGKEDLGNGTSVIFQLESGFNPASGKLEQGGALFGRQAFLGLSNESWGTLTVGQQYNAADDIVAGIDPFGTAWGQASAASTFGSSVSARQTPIVKYVSPSFDGFKFATSVGHTNKKTNGVKENQTLASFAAGYVNGPVEVGASFDYEQDKSKDRKAKAWTVAAAYDFDVVKAHLGYGQQRDGMVGGDFGFVGGFAEPKEIAKFDKDGLKAQAWFAGVTAPVGDAGKLIVGYQGGIIKEKDATAKVKTHIVSAGYQHNLSKRTHVYVLGSYGKAKLNLSTVPNLSKLTKTQAVVGLQHRF